MAKKNDKDLKIEALENKVKNLEEARSTRARWDSIPHKWQVAIAIVLVAILFSMIIYFYLEIRRTIEVALITEEDFHRITMIVKDTNWKVSKSSFSDLQSALNDKRINGDASITVDDNKIEILVEGEAYSYFGIFTYDNGYIAGTLEGKRARMFFSESILKKGRTLTLNIDDMKIVFYESE